MGKGGFGGPPPGKFMKIVDKLATPGPLSGKKCTKSSNLNISATKHAREMGQLGECSELKALQCVGKELHQYNIFNISDIYTVILAKFLP